MAVTLPSKDFAWWAIVQKNTFQYLHEASTSVRNPSESSEGQASHLPEKVLMAAILVSKYSAWWAIVQKSAVQNPRGRVPTAVTCPNEDSAGRVVVGK